MEGGVQLDCIRVLIIIRVTIVTLANERFQTQLIEQYTTWNRTGAPLHAFKPKHSNYECALPHRRKPQGIQTPKSGFSLEWIIPIFLRNMQQIITSRRSLKRHSSLPAVLWNADVNPNV